MLGRLTAYVAPFVLRRTKEEVAPDLPDKIVDIVRVDLGKEHRRIYDQYLARERAWILDLLRDVDANRMTVLAAITRLRQLGARSGSRRGVVCARGVGKNRVPGGSPG